MAQGEAGDLPSQGMCKCVSKRIHRKGVASYLFKQERRNWEWPIFKDIGQKEEAKQGQAEKWSGGQRRWLLSPGLST